MDDLNSQRENGLRRKILQFSVIFFIVVLFYYLGFLHKSSVAPSQAPVETTRYYLRFTIYGTFMLFSFYAMYVYRAAISFSDILLLGTWGVSCAIMIIVSYLEMGWSRSLPPDTVRVWLYHRLGGPMYYGSLWAFYLSMLGLFIQLVRSSRRYLRGYDRLAPDEFHAFLSYSHKNIETVDRLHSFLSSYWVPGVPGRSVFRDLNILKASELGEQIRSHVCHSRYMILCWSVEAEKSDWVQKECQAFVNEVGPEKVLICKVTDEAPPLPRELRALEESEHHQLLIPELYGWTRDTSRRDEAKGFLPEAYRLLATIAGLTNTFDEVVRSRRFHLGLIGAGIVLVVASIVIWELS